MRQGERLVPLLKLLVLLGVFLAAAHYLLPLLTSPTFQQFVIDVGLWGYLIITLYTILSHVIAPLSGSAVVALSITLYGIKTGLWLIYIASLVSAVINFYISRRYGRALVERLAGREGLAKIDSFATVEGKGALWFARIFGFAVGEFVSYAAGLTTIRFGDYMIITVIGGLIPTIAMQSVFRTLDFGSERGLILWGASVITVALMFGLGFLAYRKYKNG